MATYCIGDIHACYDELVALLNLIKFDEKKDNLIFTGDLIGRGPKPLETMNFMLEHKHCIHATMGNHDLNFLAIVHNIVKAKEIDNLQILLDADNLEEIVKFIKNMPFMYVNKKLSLCVAHAGIYPFWSFSYAKEVASELSAVLKDKYRSKVLLQNMYSNAPVMYDPNMQGLNLWRFGINAFTRMRLLYRSGILDYKNTSINPKDVQTSGLFPWYDLGDIGRGKNKQFKVIFGHWAALNGQCQKPFVKAIDTGCVWGDRLTAYCVEEDKFYSVKSKGYSQI